MAIVDGGSEDGFAGAYAALLDFVRTGGERWATTSSRPPT